jgi:DNA-directed RNA polymerase specialized sigma24 family protein
MLEGRDHVSPKEARRALLSPADLLAILDANPDRAEKEYVRLFAMLVKYFEWNRKQDPEDLAQETMRRAFSRFQAGQKITVEDPAGYFYGIARNLLRESWRKPRMDQIEDPDLPPPEPSFRNLTRGEQLIFLRECLKTLPRDEFDMLLAYVEGNGEAWAQEAGLPLGTLRTRIYRIRKRLEELARPKRS